MFKLAIIFCLFLSGCASISQIKIPSNCDVIRETNQAVTIVCPHEIKVN